MNMLKTLSVAVLSIGISFGQFVLTGQMSTSVNYDSTVAFSTPYTGVILAGDGWELSAQLTDGDFIIEEAKYTWGMDDNTSFTFGAQALPYGIAWGLHRPADNMFNTTPRMGGVMNGIGVSTSVLCIGIQAFHSDTSWTSRVSYSLSGYAVGLSANIDEGKLIDISGNKSFSIVSMDISLEYDLSDEIENPYWVRSVMTTDKIPALSILIGYDADVTTYGAGWKLSEKLRMVMEMTTGEYVKMIGIAYNF